MLFLLFSTSSAFANEPKFMCFHTGGPKQLQIYEYRSSAAKEGQPTPQNFKKPDGYHDVICSYMAECIPVMSEAEAKSIQIPTNTTEFAALRARGSRLSLVECMGRAPYVMGYICAGPVQINGQPCPPTHCPSLNRCQARDAIYNTPGQPATVIDPEDPTNIQPLAPAKLFVNPNGVVK